MSSDQREKRRASVMVWVAKLVWQTNAKLFSGLVFTTLIRGVLPAALALTIRGLINSAVEVADLGTLEIAPLVPWLILGFALSTVDAVSRLASRLFTERLEDDLNLRITGDVLTHAATLDLEAKDHSVVSAVGQITGRNRSLLFAGGLAVAEILDGFLVGHFDDREVFLVRMVYN